VKEMLADEIQTKVSFFSRLEVNIDQRQKKGEHKI
jgi:hypothetical protein